MPRGPVGSTLAEAYPQEAEMFIWVLIISMAVVGGFWVKTRRQRKAKQTPYVPN